jgi:hypothetical protein
MRARAGTRRSSAPPRQCPLGIAGVGHGVPRRVRAPHGLLDCDWDCMGLFLGFAATGGGGGLHGVIPQNFARGVASATAWG